MAVLTLFCLIDGMATSFPVDIDRAQTVGHLKDEIRTKRSNYFDLMKIDADQLTLWRVSIPVGDLPALLASSPNNKKLLDSLQEEQEGQEEQEKHKKKTKLHEMDVISDFFKKKPPKKTIHIIVQPPQSATQNDPEVAMLRKQLSDMTSSSINVGIIVKPEKKVICNWCATIDTVTVSDLIQTLTPYYPQYDRDDYMELHFYKTYTSPSEAIRNDEDLRRILRVGKTQSMNKLIISLATPTKTFSAWTFKDVISEYNLSESTDVGIEILPPFTDVQAAPLVSDLEKKALEHLIHEVEFRVMALKLVGANEATRAMVVASFLVAATTLFKEDLYLASQRNLSGRRGNGPLDFSVHPQKTHSYTLGVTEVKKDDFQQGVAQNIVQLESALTSKKRKRETHEIDGEEEPLVMRSYGIVTDASQWMLVECTLHENETVTYRMKELERTVNYSGEWQKDARFVFERLVWLWSRMRDEIPERERYSRKTRKTDS